MNIKKHIPTNLQSAIPIIVLLFFCGQIQGQITSPTSGNRDTTQVINIEWSDIFVYEVIEKDTLQRLLGNVELSQDTIYMYADSARIWNSTDLTAIGNVVLLQGDSTAVFADSVVYNADIKIADLYGSVVLDNQGQQLFTDYLKYDLNTKIATYYTGATIQQDSVTIRSERGYYYLNTKEMFFKDSVVVYSPDFSLRSDTLQFNTETQIATFLAPTLINQDSTKIYTEGGYYNTQNRTALLSKNPQYVEGEKIAIADTMLYDGVQKEMFLKGNARFEEGERVATADRIRYNEITELTLLEGNARTIDVDQNIVADTISYDKRQKSYATRGRSRIVDGNQILLANEVDYDKETEMGIAKGDVIWRDTAENITIVADYARYKKENDYIKASGGRNGRPLFISLIDGDSLFMTSDTLVSLEGDTLLQDTSRLMLAYADVRIYKSDLQAVCDSLVYNTTDSLFWFYDDPLIWSDTTQFSADTIKLQMANNQIDKILLRKNSFIVNSPDEKFFNQIKGKNSIAYFTDGELDYVHVVGNAESVYYPLDEERAYIGVNKTLCSEMKIYFGDNTVTGIKFFAKPEATLFPMKKADHRSLMMPGFSWEMGRRPTSVDDLFEERKEEVAVLPVSLPVAAPVLEEAVEELVPESAEKAIDLLKKDKKKLPSKE